MRRAGLRLGHRLHLLRGKFPPSLGSSLVRLGRDVLEIRAKDADPKEEVQHVMQRKTEQIGNRTMSTAVSTITTPGHSHPRGPARLVPAAGVPHHRTHSGDHQRG